ncbi:hypothetical protein HPB47_012406 [Ixodes persulcatus]|uniref:Uncharacterized protein n=1 Tax=Ixodes persulcatus TaxID=34615 RepID=A0AC60NTL6_IXOPE|nr:hypothetical protein HPB47_012406 [Ixodes persulcatus]
MRLLLENEEARSVSRIAGRDRSRAEKKTPPLPAVVWTVRGRPRGGPGRPIHQIGTEFPSKAPPLCHTGIFTFRWTAANAPRTIEANPRPGACHVTFRKLTGVVT